MQAATRRLGACSRGRWGTPLARVGAAVPAAVLAIVLVAAPRWPSGATAACVAPNKPVAAANPYCFVPDTVSPEAQKVLATMSAGGTPRDFSTHAKAVEQRADFLKRSSASRGRAKEFFSSIQNETLGGVPGALLTPVTFKPGGPMAGKALLYLHGGGYVVGDCAAQWSVPAGVARDLGIRVWCINYRLAPEHPFPAALDDAEAAYRALLQKFAARDVALMGDSSGAGLALALMRRLKGLGLAQPAAAVFFSPWAELTKRGDTQTTLTAVDPSLQYENRLESAALAYAGWQRDKLADPLVSPLRGDWSKAAVGALPPVLLQVGLRDTFLSPVSMLYRKLKAAGQPVEFSPFEAMWHVFQSNVDLPEAAEAASEAAAFLRRHLVQ